MTLRLLVDWDNPDHPLLADAHARIDVQADGAALAPVARAQGSREYEFPEGTSTVQLSVSFRPELRAVGLAPAQQHEVLRARQTYRVVSGTELRPDRMAPMMQPHPLIDSISISNRHGALRAHVHTQFVDVHPFWWAYCATRRRPDLELLNQHTTDHHPGTQLRALAYTGGHPLLWLAVYPDTLAFAPSEQVSCLVFFRPRNDFYTRVDQRHQIFRASRFLLSPVPAASDWRCGDQFRRGYVWLRAGFEQALLDSGRQLVLLMPWQSESAYGDAVTSRLPNLAYAALRLLWARGEIATGHLDVQLGRLGLAGYSAGGAPLCEALRANMLRVREVYAFDANRTSRNVTLAAEWFRSDPDNRLRMSGGYTFAPAGSGIGPNLQVEARIGDTTGRVTVMPRHPREYDDGSIPHWEYALALEPGLRGAGRARHQFAIFGSYPGNSVPPHTSFLRQFLDLSGY